QAWHLKILSTRIGVQYERIVLRSEAPAELAGRDVLGAVAMRCRQDDIGGHGTRIAVSLRTPTDERARAREVRAAGIDQRAVDRRGFADYRPVHAGVVSAVFMMHGAHDRQLVGALSKLGQEFRDLN